MIDYYNNTNKYYYLISTSCMDSLVNCTLENKVGINNPICISINNTNKFIITFS